MKFGFVAWALVLMIIGYWTWVVPQPANSQRTATSDAINATLEKNRSLGYSPEIEPSAQEVRVSQRQSALKSLEMPWSTLCTKEGRHSFISGLQGYYSRRESEAQVYPANWGPKGAEYIAQQWKTADDLRIEQLTRQIYSEGYLNSDEVMPAARKMLISVIKGERVTGSGCPH
jgi:hypothetical protein